MQPFRILFYLAVLGASFCLPAAESPHGVCAHLCRGEFADAEEEFGI